MILLLAALLQISPASLDDKATEAALYVQFADILFKAQRVQEAYFRAHGRYWQGIETPTTLPDETTKTRPPDLTKKPVGQAESWEDLFTGKLALKPSWEGSMRIDVYSGPRGQGWTLTISVSEKGARQERTWNFGPEKEREDRGWRKVEQLSEVPPKGVPK